MNKRTIKTSYHLSSTLIALALILTSCNKRSNIENQIVDNAEMNNLVMYELTNANKLRMSVTNFGGRIVSLWVPDKSGKFADIVLGYDSLSHYLKDNSFFGALIGRYANRIARGEFSLDGKVYNIPVNSGVNTLHSGPNGFHNVFWNMEKVPSKNGEQIVLRYKSKAGEEGFPGNLEVKVTYILTNENELVILYEALTDETTIVNLTDHSYFNLAGAGHGDILGHLLEINADYFTPVDETLIPTGEVAPVAKTSFDFRLPHPIGGRINDDNGQLKIGQGYDHNYIINKVKNELSMVARVKEPNSGRVLELWTTDIGVQFYSGNFLNESILGKEGKVYGYRSAFCLETQHFPDSPNKVEFPSTVLRPGEVYHKKTVYKFRVD